MKHPRAHHALARERLARRPHSIDDGKQFVDFGVLKNATVSILRGAWLEPHDTGDAVDLMPLESQDLALGPPARVVCKGCHRLQRDRQLRQSGLTTYKRRPRRQ